MTTKEEVKFKSREEIWKKYFPQALREEDVEEASEEPNEYGLKLALEVLELVRQRIKN